MTPDLTGHTMPERFQRSGPPVGEALTRVMAMREALGITRIADITGLDRVGIPVMQAVRPFSLSNVVSQGKGGSAAQAVISAVLESVESFCAERLQGFDAVVASANALDIPSERFDGHLRQDAPADWRARQTAWVAADNLLGGSRGMIPLELVHTAYVDPPFAHDGLFVASTTGLAASFDQRDAIVHGLLECVERDALARANRTHGFLQRCQIDLETIDNPAVCNLLETLDDRGLLVGLWHAPSPTGLPVIWCHLMEKASARTALLDHPADGSAASFDPSAAIVHAIYEAAQSRLAAISGARDDMTRAAYPKYPDWEKIAAHKRLIAQSHRGGHFSALTAPRECSGDSLSLLLTMLEQIGVKEIFKVQIDATPVVGLSVVRIVVPALQLLLQG